MKKVLEIRNEIGVYNNTLNKFIKTYELKIFNLKYLNDYTLKELRDYHEVKDELYSLLISLKNSLREYSSDYYAWKSLNEIAKKENIEVSDEEVEEEITAMAEESGYPRESVAAYVDRTKSRESIRNRLSKIKVLDFLVNASNIKNMGRDAS